MKCPKCHKSSRGHQCRIREQTQTDAAMAQQRRAWDCPHCGHEWDTLELPFADVAELRRKAFLHELSEAKGRRRSALKGVLEAA